MKKFIVKGLSIILGLSISSLAGAGSGKVTQIITHQADVVMFVTEHHTDSPTCNKHGWAFDVSTATGQAMLSQLLHAVAIDKKVQVHGSGDCAAWGDRERPRFIAVNY